MTIVQLLIVALVGEAVWETCKMFYQKGKVSLDRIGAAVVGLLIAFGAQMDIFLLVGISLVIPYLGYVLTGLLISRGANVVHDLWSAMTGLAAKGKLVKTTSENSIVFPANREDLSIDIKPVAKKKAAKAAVSVSVPVPVPVPVPSADSSALNKPVSASVDALKSISDKLVAGTVKVIGSIRRDTAVKASPEVKLDAPKSDSPDFEDHVRELEPEVKPDEPSTIDVTVKEEYPESV